MAATNEGMDAFTHCGIGAGIENTGTACRVRVLLAADRVAFINRRMVTPLLRTGHTSRADRRLCGALIRVPGRSHDFQWW